MLKKTSKKTKKYVATNLDTMRRVFSGIESGNKYWKCKQGQNLIRILPSIREDGAFAYKTHMHHGFKIDGENRAFPCLSAISKKPCPVCRVISYHDTDSDPDVKDALRALKTRNQFMMNIIDRAEGEPIVRLFFSPISIARDINDFINDDDYGDITDPKNGRDVKITRTGEGLSTRYSTRVKVKSTPVGMENWEDHLFNLENEAYREIPTVKKYVKYLEDCFGDVLDIEGALSDGSKDEEEETPKKRTKKSKKVKHETEETDENGEDEEEESEEEETEDDSEDEEDE